MKNNIRKEDERLKIGILGCGTICQAAHLIGTAKAKNADIVAICDIAEDLLKEMDAMYHPKRTYTDFSDMLADTEIEAIIIGIGDQFHVDCAKQAIMAGKHVLVEKPLGVSVEEILDLKQLVEEKGLVLQVGNMKRFDPGLQFAKEFIENEIGEVTTFKGWYCDSTARYQVCDNVMPILYSSEGMKKPKGNPKENKDKYYLLGHASHLFDTARYMMGDIVSVEAKHVVKGDVYSWLIACEFDNGAIGNLDLTIAIRADWHEGLEVYGTNGTVFAKTYNPWILKTSDVECCNQTTKEIRKPYNPDGHFFRRQVEGFADVILNQKEQIGGNVDDGLAAVQAIIATYESVNNGGKKVYLKDIKGGL